ncbi:hypothetical protein Anas_14028, partial [Armadillidium nasatum]
ELVPKLKEEKSKLERENEKLHSILDNFLMAREDAEEELKMLKSRHSLVLDKALEDKELIEAANREREEFEIKEKNLRKIFNIKLEIMTSFEKKKNEIKARRERERLRSVHEKKEKLLQRKLIQLRNENEKLRNRKRIVSMAISHSLKESINAQLNLKSSLKKNHPVEAAVRKRDEFNVNPAKKLKANNNEGSSSNKENRPVRQSPHQIRLVKD